MTVNLTNYTGEKNLINKNVSFAASLTGTLREGSDVVNPSIMIEAPANAVCGFNYAYIPEFKRYYFIQNCTAFRNNLTILTMTVDVLFTYKESILNSPAVIVRSSKFGDAVHSLPDDRYPIKQSDTTHVITFDSLYDANAEAGKGETMILVMTGIDEPAP
jgi:hypothetical protein